MAATSATTRPEGALARILAADPSRQAYLLLRTAFTVAPIVFGLDKFANVLTDWTKYLAPVIDRIVPGSATQDMWAVGVIEVVAGVLVALRPRWGGLVVTAWLAGIIVNLLLLGGYYDVALRDFGLLLAALALSRLAVVHDGADGWRAGMISRRPAGRP